MSIGEENILNILKNEQLDFVSQYGVSIDNIWYRYDFALLNQNTGKPYRLIEFDGI